MVGGKSEIFPIISELSDDLDYYIMKFYSKHEIPNLKTTIPLTEKLPPMT